MREPISPWRAEIEYGFTAPHERMDNDELRFRLYGRDGNAYIRTVASSQGAWQNSHQHSTFRELYLVERGWMAFATPKKGSNIPNLTIFGPGEYFVSPKGEVHNVYLAANSEIHTIKFGVRGNQARFEPEDWFNKNTQHLKEEEILRLAAEQAKQP